MHAHTHLHTHTHRTLMQTEYEAACIRRQCVDIYGLTHIYTHARTHTYTHTHTHTQTHTHTHTHAHTCKQSMKLPASTDDLQTYTDSHT